jgi:hypothetical protein
MPGTVRPDPSTLGVVGERGSHHEDCSLSVSGCSAWLPPGKEQVAVQAEEVLSVPPELAEILGPGVGLVTGEAASGDGIVGHDLAVSDAVGIGVVFRVEEDQGLGVADLEPGSLELVTKCAATWNWARPSRSSSSSTASARAAAVGATPAGSPGECPKPGRSIAMTS